MMVELVGTAKEMCTLYGVYDYLGDHQEDLEGRPSEGLNVCDIVSSCEGNFLVHVHLPKEILRNVLCQLMKDFLIFVF